MNPIHSSPSSSSVISSSSSSSAILSISSASNQQSNNFHVTQQQKQLLKRRNEAKHLKSKNYFDNLLYSENNLLTMTHSIHVNNSDLRVKIETLIKLNSKSFNNRSTFSTTPMSTLSSQTEKLSKSPSLNDLNKSNSPQLATLPPKSDDINIESPNTISSLTSYDENFTSSLFNLFITYDFDNQNKNEIFNRIYNDLQQSHVIKNPFLVIAKLGHECFKLNMLDISECLLELAINNIDTSSLRLKMATLSTLSACYWRQSKFPQSINCMNLELDMASHLNKSADMNNLYLGNIYRIYGNLASAFQRLNKLEDCLKNFELQLNISLTIKENLLIINTNNSIGIVHNKLKQFSKSLEYFGKSFDLIEQYNNNDIDKFLIKKLKLKQCNLIGDCCLKLAMYEKSRSYFHAQLDISNELMYEHQSLKFKQLDHDIKELPIDDMNHHWYQECLAMYNLALINTKMKNFNDSVDFYEKCLAKLHNNQSTSQQILELNGRVYIGLINNCLSLKDNLRAALHAHSMLDFTIKEMKKISQEDETDDDETSTTVNNQRRYRYLKFLEMSACSKLASCYWKQNRLDDALKLYQREADLAKQMNNTFYLTRAYSHMAQVHFNFKEYDKTIGLYKQILHLIEMNLLKKRPIECEEDDAATSDFSDNNTEANTKQVYLARDDRLVQMIYFTLSNIGLCMEMLNKLDDAYLMFQEQFEISKLIKNLKFKANALLNLTNLNLNRIKQETDENEQEKRQQELIQTLKELFLIYSQLDDLNGQLFTSQSLAYCFHTSGNLNLAIKYYNHNIELCKSNESQLSDDMLKKSIFNLSLCLKMNHDFKKALKFQLEYLELIENSEQNSYLRFKSLGIVSDLIFEIDKSDDNCKHCIQLNIERLKIIKNLPNDSIVSESILKDLIENEILEPMLNETKNPSILEDKSDKNEPKLKLINNCLESIAKYYYHLENYQQVLKFKLIQLEIKKELEQEATENASSNELIEISKDKCKIWFEIGSLFLLKFEDTNESFIYFELALNGSIQNKDLLLESLTLGNMGLCRQKSGEYDEAIDHFKNQLEILSKRLNLIDFKSINPLVLHNQNINDIKELISIRIDMARSYSQLSKCAELLSLQNKQSVYYLNDSVEYLNESFGYLNEYFKECEYLYETFAKTFLKQLEIIKANENDAPSETSELNDFIKDLCEHIFIDYDNSLAKLSHFYAAYDQIEPIENIEKSIELSEKRLKLLNYCSKLILNQTYWTNLNIQINFTLATFYSKDTDTLIKSRQLCDYIINIFSEIQNELDPKTDKRMPIFKDNIYLIETLNLICDISLIEYGNFDYSQILDKALNSYYLLWEYNEKNDNNYSRLKNQNILKLKYDSICRVSFLYKKLKMPKECIEILMDSVNRLTLEFQNLQHLTHFEQKKISNIESNYSLNPKDYFLTQYIEYLFLIHRRIALMHMNRAIESKLVNKHQDLIVLSLKHVNEALTYLNYHKEFHSSEVLQFREASIFFLFGKCHRYLNSSEMALEMFASSLDLYENIIPQNQYDLKTCLNDKMVSVVLSQQINLINKNRDDLLNTIRYDEDDETSVNYVKRIDELYGSIEDILIKLSKLKEALLVTERHRSKVSRNLNDLNEILTFEQIETSVKKQNLNALFYFSYIEISSKLSCWFLMPARNILKFHQFSCNLLDDLLFLLFNKIKTIDEEDQNFLLQNIYNLIIKPFEKDLFNEIGLLNDQLNDKNNLVKPSIFFVYDENMFKLPFHLLKITSDLSLPNLFIKTNQKYLFELFEINCSFSIKYLSSENNESQRYNNNEPNMKVISNEAEMDKLFESFNSNQFDLLVLLVNSEHNDINSLNTLVNSLLAKRICKAIMLEFNYTPTNKNPKQELAESESNAKLFLRRLYTKLNRNSLKPSLILTTLINEQHKNQQQLLNYLIFGNLTSNFEFNSQSPESNNSDLKSIIEQLSEDFDQVTFSQIIIQYLKLNLKFEAASSILNIVIVVLSDFLADKFSSSQEITVETLFQSFFNMHYESSHFVASRLLLKSAGFMFYNDKSARISVKLPDESLIFKCSLILKCLNVLQKFSSEFLVSFYELSSHLTGREFLLLLQNNLSNQPKRDKVTLILNSELYKQHDLFLKEIASLIISDKNNIRIEIETKVLNYIILLTVITLNNKKMQDNDIYLQNYIELFFKNIDKQKLVEDDFDENSSHSTVSSILGIQNNKPKLERTNSKQEHEIKIYREINVPNISSEEIANAKNCAKDFKNIIQIQIKNNSDYKKPQLYENYLNNLIDNDLNRNNFKPKSINSDQFNNLSYQQLVDNDLKNKNFIKLEQKEYLDRITTITTTVKTFTKDDLFMLFDNNLFDNDLYDNELYSASMDQLNDLSEINGCLNKQNVKIPNINKNVYSCLTNYISDYSII